MTVPATVMVNNVAVPVDLEDGLDFPQLPIGARPPLTAEEEALFTHAASPSTDDIEVFYIEKFTEAGTGNDLSTQGYSYTNSSPGFDPGQFSNTIIITANPSAIVLAHELGHLLTSDGSHHEDRENLMYQPGTNTQTYLHMKRLSEYQRNSMLKSPLLDDE